MPFHIEYEHHMHLSRHAPNEAFKTFINKKTSESSFKLTYTETGKSASTTSAQELGQRSNTMHSYV